MTVRVTGNNSPRLGASETFTITVKDVAPAVALGPRVSIVSGTTPSRNGTFVDPVTRSVTATVDYGERTGVHAHHLNADKTFTLRHK